MVGGRRRWPHRPPTQWISPATPWILVTRCDVRQEGAQLVPTAVGELADVKKPVELVQEPSTGVDRALGELTNLTIQQPALEVA